MEINQIFGLIFTVVFYVVMIILNRLGLVKKKDLKEMENIMKTFNNRSVAQVFTNQKTEYELDERLNELVESGTTDLQELVNSARGTSLEELLKRMLPEDIAAQYSYSEEYDRCADALEELSASIDAMEQARNELKMPLSASYSDIYKAYEEKVKDLHQKAIKEQESASQQNISPVEGKGVSKDET